MVLAGIKNCNTVRSARRWLDDNNIEYDFLDLRSDQFNKKTLGMWLESVEWTALLNKRSTSWRGLEDGDRENLDEARAMKLLLQHPTLIKRPVLQLPGSIELGFNAEKYSELFK
ncbi:MAG: Spx/MgsR family RNA polymerase-binding regulatory protein [Gammaproteobacteria bacterium]|nr:Spx/MgsR family RNA polymerase-binding regulatory protein [Gammaproteobacteria bacterium]